MTLLKLSAYCRRRLTSVNPHRTVASQRGGNIADGSGQHRGLLLPCQDRLFLSLQQNPSTSCAQRLKDTW